METGHYSGECFYCTALVALFLNEISHSVRLLLSIGHGISERKRLLIFLHKFASVRVAKSIGSFAVTHHLQKWMEHHGMKNSNYQVYAIRVCEDIFFGENGKPDNQITRILNVTCFNDEHKNISGILRVVKELSKKRQDFE